MWLQHHQTPDNLLVKSNLRPLLCVGNFMEMIWSLRHAESLVIIQQEDTMRGHLLCPMILISWWRRPLAPCHLIVPVTTWWCHQCYPMSKWHHLITPRANKLDGHQENILKSRWGYTGTDDWDASESNPSRVNGVGRLPRARHFLTPCPWPLSPRWDEWIILSHRDSTGVDCHWSIGYNGDTWLAGADLVLSVLISKDHGGETGEINQLMSWHHVSRVIISATGEIFEIWIVFSFSKDRKAWVDVSSPNQCPCSSFYHCIWIINN